MNDQPPPLDRNDGYRSNSPKRKKARQKYAPKACVSCRRSKLKCSGDNPCQRCRDNGKRCFFSEDQTAAEALQNLSRPSIPQRTSTSTPISSGIGLARRTIIPRHQNNERRASDATALGLSMEARMCRIESMMEALLQERTMHTTPSAGLLRENGIDIALSTSIADSVSPGQAFLSQPSQAIRSQDPIDPLLDTDTANVRVGNRNLVFPDPAIYQIYTDTFFHDIHCYYPCVDEQNFRSRSQNMLAVPEVHPDDVCFLALNYITFAFHAVSNETTAPGYESKPPGWHWLQIADEVVGKRQLVGRGDIHLAQFLLFKVRTSIASPLLWQNIQLRYWAHCILHRLLQSARSLTSTSGCFP
ncbi:uncharacterized protein M421DRAFT_352781 [Didymella exigua CBS 183.55]|uniref:Zn(2)-C6 fungal-type domain-containing protein n=1 Tax=Didymella exigua CBS 183.55 TaxID=1150837 RepID=A0A6A5R5X2_9PLEO|nr:uncharacterized protein M421DRAFT_352781 [Didymella exigua CBS 183.55]KAF1922590.1 hypothetical protein M421DRAFT_352781 [Didymella exigua CBS 183.55]